MPKNPMSSKKADQYDNDDFNYLDYWTGRDYEHEAEEMAIKRLINGKKFKTAADIGGGYGRLCILLEDYSDKVTLLEPSKAQLDIAKKFLKDHPTIDQKLGQADALPFKAGSLDLVTMIRVMHHLPNPVPELSEVHRVLAKDGYFVLELANYAHARNRLKHLLQGKPIPKQPIDIRSERNKRAEEIAFVNHNPQTVIHQLDSVGFSIERILSVSNLRSTTLKKYVPQAVMLNLEKVMQPTLAMTYFGPSVFFLLKKK
ncbi:MAG: class I SAM-dependent methyltransferase [Candidatus Saccharimonadales bacterium]